MTMKVCKRKRDGDEPMLEMGGRNLQWRRREDKVTVALFLGFINIYHIISFNSFYLNNILILNITVFVRFDPKDFLVCYKMY